jgi:hypothetical protein
VGAETIVASLILEDGRRGAMQLFHTSGRMRALRSMWTVCAVTGWAVAVATRRRRIDTGGMVLAMMLAVAGGLHGLRRRCGSGPGSPVARQDQRLLPSDAILADADADADADAGRGIVVIDPNGDLVTDILSRLP